MASYLFNADDEAMARWKARAADRGYSFAEYLRALLDADGDEKPRATPEPRRSEKPVIPAPVPPPPLPATSGKSTYEPDFKAERKKK